MTHYSRSKRWVRETTTWLVLAVLASVICVPLVHHASAATSGKTTLYLKEQGSDIDSTYNALGLTPAEATTDLNTATSSTTNVNVAGAPTNFCKSNDAVNANDNFNQLSASSASTGERCMMTFISLQVGQAFTMSTSDTASISATVYTSESASQVTSAPRIYIYRWTGSGSSVASGDLIAKWTTCADPGTSPSLCTSAQTAVAPANNITFAATDRIVVIVSQNVTRSRSGTFVSNYIGNSTRSPSSSISLGYSIITPNKPTLSGSNDDDFTTPLASTTCSNTTFNTIWHCDAPSAAGSSAVINDANAGGGGGDSSGWLWLKNSCSSCTASNFGTTPSNAFIYQNLSGYGNGTVRTVVNASHAYRVTSDAPVAPTYHTGIVLWASNTDYLELQIQGVSFTNSPDTIFVGVNNSGVWDDSSSVDLNPAQTGNAFGRVWLGFSNTGGSYQPQYSIDGSTWINIGSPISHTAFSRVGLNALAAATSPASSKNYAGAFEWFQYNFAPLDPTMDQLMRGGTWFMGGSKQSMFWAT